ncbi:Retrovirus-related Pol polyprotein from transposon TNT 1-94 [Sesamum angolense]|uniref:Retrovirus-related Pol polyprotein from transposon TNT 1-94 n=1 Tax=Sesamum angolense TaxID=2727404 RepID=A0AAE2BK36_9LAMI|nr:Retrovirus-related Pol polyprotein from transposon TNT 1-94 [Sesamum angolense]
MVSVMVRKLYQLERDIASITQGDFTKADYFTKIQMLWDELAQLRPMPECTCGCACTCDLAKATTALVEQRQLIQFLMGLNDKYDNRQRQVHLDVTVRHDGAVMHAGKFEKRKEGNNFRRKGVVDKRSLKCEHCDKSGRDKSTCFKLHGVPDWYKELGDQKRKSNAGHRAYAVQQGTEQKEVTKDNTTSISDMVMELVRVLKQIPHNPIQTPERRVICAAIQKPFITLNMSASVLSILLPDGSTKQVTQSGFLSSHFILLDNLTKTIVAVAKHSRHLYILDKDSFSPAFMNQFLSSHFSFVSQVVGLDLSLWHQKLGHLSHKKLKSYTQAQGHLEWERAMTERLKALEANNTWEEFTSKLAEFGFTQLVHDHCLFIKTAPDGFLALLVYVDEILVMGPSESLIMEVKSYLDALFTIKDLDTGITTAFSVLTPLPPGIKLTSKSGAMFREPANTLRQYLQLPTEQHWHAALHVVCYLKGTPTTGPFFPSLNTFQLTTYVDVDWGACVDSRCLVTSYCVFLGSSLISWKTKKQNIGALHITANLMFHERTKHLDIDCHVVRDKYKDSFISPSFISSKLQLADIFTKSLSGFSFHSILSKLGLLSVSPVPA